MGILGQQEAGSPPAQPPPLPRRRRTPPRYYSEDDDDDNNNGFHGRDDDDDREEDDEQQSGSGDSAGSTLLITTSSSDSEDGVAGGIAEEQPAAEERDSDDDDRPLSVVSRARILVHRGSTSTTPPAPAPPEPSPAAPAPAPPESSPPPTSSSSDSSSVIRNVTVANSSTFDCTICYLPLKSPIFQCTFGHVVCSPCHDKLGQATSCHVCRVPIPDGYFRCNAMEQVVESIRVPCPHAAHGCAVKPAYHDHDDHARTCAFKPCHCPGEGCGFVSPVQATLLEHFATVHGWPCSAESTKTSGINVHLRKGFNVVVVTATDDQGGAVTEEQYTLVLKVEQVAPVCNTITVFCIHPCNNGTVILYLYYYRRCSSYIESVELNANGMPGPSTCLPFLVPAYATQGEDEIRISVRRPLVDLA